MINILEGTDYTWSCDSDGGTPPANISGFLGLRVLQGVQGEYTIHPGKRNQLRLEVKILVGIFSKPNTTFIEVF